MDCRELVVWTATLTVVLGAVAATIPSSVADPSGHETGISGADTVAGASGPVAPPGVAPRPVEPDRILIQVRVHPDGSATWTIEHRMSLDEDGDEKAFQRARESVADNESELTDAMTRRARDLATRAQEETGRTMVVENVSVSARKSLAGDQGIVAYRFRWYGFAGVNDGDLVIGDAMTGLILDERTTLQVTWPGEARAESLAPTPDERTRRSATWKGSEEFAPGEPRVVVRSETEAFGTADEPPAGGYGNTLPILATVALATAVLGGLVVRRRREGETTDAGTGAHDDANEAVPDDAPSERPANRDDGGGASPRAESVPPSGEVDEPSPTRDRMATSDEGSGETRAEADADSLENDPDTGADAAAGEPDEESTTGKAKPDAANAEPGSAESTAGAGDDGSSPTPDDLLSNEEKVIQLLENNGGRTRQQDVVEAFGWSETKTSEVITEMREADALEVYRLGRENVLALPGEFDIGGGDE
jgi:hypothetical protein